MNTKTLLTIAITLTAISCGETSTKNPDATPTTPPTTEPPTEPTAETPDADPQPDIKTESVQDQKPQTLKLIDANDELIGRITTNTITIDNEDHLDIELKDLATGFALTDNSATCQFESTDCTGNCFLTSDDKITIVSSTAILILSSNLTATTTIPANTDSPFHSNMHNTKCTESTPAKKATEQTVHRAKDLNFKLPFHTEPLE